MITISHRGQKISLSQKSKTVTARVNGVTVYLGEGTAEEAIKAAKKFIDEMLGVVPE